MRLIVREQEEAWTARLEATGDLNWMVLEKPGRERLRLEAHFVAEKQARFFKKQLGGRVERVAPKAVAPSPPVRVHANLEIVHEEKASRAPGRLIVPYGMAFGSGEHATTLLLLRALARAKTLASKTMLDLGTGSGVLALAARALGAVEISATDFDPAAIRTARRNEALNFRSRRISWEVADVKKLRARGSCDLITANLFSGLLIETAPRLARALRPGGELWLSGVLRSQDAEVAAACQGAGLRHLRTAVRGKWIMQQWVR